MNTQEVLAFLKANDPAAAAKVEAAMSKSSPGAGDVHQPSASGKGKRRKKPPASVSGDPHKEGSTTDGAVEKLTIEAANRMRLAGVLDVDIIKAAERSGATDVAQIVRDGWKKSIAFDIEDDARREEVAKETGEFMYDKTEVDYTDESPGPDYCGGCQHMAGQDACEIVKGVIRPEGWCKKFADRFTEEQAPQVQKKDEPRQLKLMDDTKYAHTPFPWDANALASLRPDQVPRFMSAVTKPQNLPVEAVKLRKLTALQNRVEVDKVRQMQAGGGGTKPPVVARLGKGRFIIADGHHRLTAQWLNGAKKSAVSFVDLEPVDQAVSASGGKHDEDWGVPFEVKKVDPDQRLIFGWASVAEIDGKLVIDKQGDVIMPDDLERAVYDFVLFAQHPNEQDVEKYLTELHPDLGAAFKAIIDDVGIEKRATMGFMHEKIGVGRLIESMAFTKEKQKALGVDLGMQGWWIGFKVDNDEVWALAKEGKLPEFSIGGRGRRVEV